MQVMQSFYEDLLNQGREYDAVRRVRVDTAEGRNRHARIDHARRIIEAL